MNETPLKLTATLCAIFALLYAALIAVGLALGLVIERQFGSDPKLLGTFVNVFSFFFSLHLAKLWAVRLVTPSVPEAMRHHLHIKPNRRTLILIFCAVIAVAIDIAYHRILTSYALGEPKPINPLRLLLVGGAYVLLGSVFFDDLGAQSKRRKTAESDDGPKLVRQFQALSRGDKSTLIAALDNRDAVLMTPRGSDNDLMWTELSRLGWMARRDMPSMADLPRAESFAYWAITDLGRVSIPTLVRRAHSA